MTFWISSGTCKVKRVQDGYGNHSIEFGFENYLTGEYSTHCHPYNKHKIFLRLYPSCHNERCYDFIKKKRNKNYKKNSKLIKA